MDVYSEVIVSRNLVRNPQAIQKALKTTGWILLIAGVVVSFLLFIPAALVWILYFIANRVLEVDYEYMLTNDEMDLELVLGGKTRKNMLSFSLSQVLIIAPWESTELEPYTHLKPMDMSARDPWNRPYVLVCTVGGEKKKVYLQLNDDMLHKLKMMIPGKVILNK